MADPIALIELGFTLACAKHEETHDRWRALHLKLERLRCNGAPYDAGDHDGRIDCLLREMEDDQLRYIIATGKRGGHPDSRTKLQIQLSRYWISSTYELLRTTSQAIGEESEYSETINKHKHMFAAYRVPIAKQEPHRISKASLIQEFDLEQFKSEKAMEGKLAGIEVPYQGPGTYRVKPLLDADTGSIGFVVFDGKTKTLVGEPRRKLSDMLLEMGEGLTDLDK